MSTLKRILCSHEICNVVLRVHAVCENVLHVVHLSRLDLQFANHIKKRIHMFVEGMAVLNDLARSENTD